MSSLSSNKSRPLARMDAIKCGAMYGVGGGVIALASLPLDGIVKSDLRFIANSALVGAVGIFLLNEALGLIPKKSHTAQPDDKDDLWTSKIANQAEKPAPSTTR